jgi:LysR family glycine cleavage system transcriptional activator
MAREPEPGLYCEKLLDEWFLPVCSPQVFAKWGPLMPHADAKGFPLLHSADEPWNFWTEPLGRKNSNGKDGNRDWTESGSTYDDSLTVLAGAEQGQGYALTRWALAARDVEIGRIVRASPMAVPCPRSYYFVCPESYLGMPKVNHLLEWLRSVVKEFAGPENIAPENKVSKNKANDALPNAASKKARAGKAKQRANV